MKFKKTLLIVILIVYSTLFIIGLFNFIIDPFFHFRAPNNGLTYPLESERYINYGIVKKL